MCRDWHVCVGRGASVSAAEGLCRTAAPESQLSCNVTTSSKCAIFDELQEKIRSIASRPAQKVTEKVQSRASRACHKLHVPVSDKSFPPRPPRPPFPPAPFTPKIITRSIVDHVVKRFKHLATCQASCNVPTFLQPHNIF